MECATKKLRMDYAARLRFREAMDPDTIELIAQLCTQVGMRMEDASSIAVTIGHNTPDQMRKRLDDLACAAEKISRLISAAQALIE